MKLCPYFEVNGERYEIRRSRYLMCELEKIRESSNVADNDQHNVVKLQEMYRDLQKLKLRTDELFDDFMEKLTDEAEQRYERIKAKYEKLRDEVMEFELNANDVLHRLNKTVIDNAERLVIIALQRDSNGKEIRTHEQAENIWCAYVDEVGQKVAQEWLNALIEHITGEDEREDENSFLAQAKARAEQAQNRRAGLARIRK
ncbi:MAG: hypothetical protein NC131_01070 [Roseburia sp.]|nr:hypothetical protein [Roseburia sp.]